MPSDRVLSAESAARLIYNTSAPSTEQVEKVRDRIDRGQLERSPRGGYTTTASSVASFLSQKAAAAAAHERPHARRFSDGKPVPGFYGDLLKDYFLAVLLQRTRQRRSNFFRVGVLAMQIALAVLPFLLFAYAYQGNLKSLVKSPEVVAAEQWAREQNYEEFGIEGLRPLDSESGNFELKYWYREKGSKRIQSRRVLQIEGDRVTSAAMRD